MLPLLLLASGLLAQQPTCSAPPPSQNATIYGQVTDLSGAFVPHAQVLLKSTAGQRTYKSTDENGCYTFTASPGDYRLLAQAEAFQTGAANVHLTVDQPTHTNVTLPLGGCTECVWIPNVGNIDLHLHDLTGTPVADASVTLTPLHPKDKQHPTTFHSEDWGHANQQQLPKGAYHLTILAPGFHPIRKTIHIKPNHDLSQSLTLEPISTR